MLSEIKEELLKQPDAIIELLEYFDFDHISPSNREIRFARNHSGGKNISIRLENNDCLYVNDFARGVSLDIFSYIIQEKSVTFREVIQKTKQILHLNDDWKPQKKQLLFGGIYEGLTSPNRETQLTVYNESVLDNYERCGNLRFLRDGISLEAQKFWDIRFSMECNSIIIPIRNEYGELVGAKARRNKNVEGDENKYYYPCPVQMGRILYGHSENYEYLFGADTIYIGESEKFCQQLYTMGIRNCVSLGSHTLSEKQAKLLLQLASKSVTFMFDEGLDLSETKRNADVLRNISGMMEIDIYFFDYRDCLDIGPKESPSDNGIEVWNNIIENHIKNINELEDICKRNGM